MKKILGKNLVAAFAFFLFCFFLNISTALADYGAELSPTNDIAIDDSSGDNFIFTGAATYNVPIEVPPGRAGMTPKLFLKYNSLRGNGWLGVGWFLDMGTIQRSTKRGVNYSGTNFVFSVNGMTTQLTARGDWGPNYYGASREKDFSQFQYITATGGWVLTTKDGTKYYYGSDTGSRQDFTDANNNYQVFKWYLNRVEDTNGNFMTVTYTKYSADNEIYLYRIDYTGNGSSLLPSNSVIFDLEGRQDAPVMYTTNWPVRTAYRLKSIETYASGQPVRQYVLNYADSVGDQYSVNTGRSLLGSITPNGYDSVAGKWSSLPPIKFSWTSNDNSIVTLQSRNLASQADYGQNSKNFYLTGDINGNNLTDIMQLYWMPGEQNFDHYYAYVHESDGQGYSSVWSGTLPNSITESWPLISTADIDGDGKAEIVSTKFFDINNEGQINQDMAVYKWGSAGFVNTGKGTRLPYATRQPTKSFALSLPEMSMETA